MKKLFLCLLTLCSICSAQAQWRVGITAGADWNQYTIDKHYMLDWHYEAQWGATFGVTGQYDINNWLALRTDVNYAQKNHREYRKLLDSTDYKKLNAYLQVPVMASFGFGGENLHGFLNLGLYGGYWLSSKLKGHYRNIDSWAVSSIDEKVEFNNKRDQRFDFGPVGGIGLEYKLTEHLATLVEARCYYSTISTQKDYMRIKDPKYNTTIGLQAAIYYIF